MALNINIIEGETTVFELDGRIDTTTAPVLEGDIDKIIQEATTIVLDCASLEYISSAGLRVILKTHKAMSIKDGVLKLTNVNESVDEILEITGFKDFVVIE